MNKPRLDISFKTEMNKPRLDISFKTEMNKNFNICFQKLFPASNMFRIKLSTIKTVKTTRKKIK